MVDHGIGIVSIINGKIDMGSDYCCKNINIWYTKCTFFDLKKMKCHWAASIELQNNVYKIKYLIKMYAPLWYRK